MQTAQIFSVAVVKICLVGIERFGLVCLMQNRNNFEFQNYFSTVASHKANWTLFSDNQFIIVVYADSIYLVFIRKEGHM